MDTPCYECGEPICLSRGIVVCRRSYCRQCYRAIISNQPSNLKRWSVNAELGLQYGSAESQLEDYCSPIGSADGIPRPSAQDRNYYTVTDTYLQERLRHERKHDPDTLLVSVWVGRHWDRVMAHQRSHMVNGWLANAE